MDRKRRFSGNYITLDATSCHATGGKAAGGKKGQKTLEHLAITGGGTVDGQGLLFWRGRANHVFRPHTVDFTHVNYGMISGPTFTRNPNHVLELGCDNCELSHISVLNPPSTGDCEKKNTCSHNTDAVDVHGTPFYIHNVNFTTGKTHSLGRATCSGGRELQAAVKACVQHKRVSSGRTPLEARLRCPNIPAVPLRAGDDNVAVHANHTLVEDSYFGTGHGVIRHDIAASGLHSSQDASDIVVDRDPAMATAARSPRPIMPTPVE